MSPLPFPPSLPLSALFPLYLLSIPQHPPTQVPAGSDFRTVLGPDPDNAQYFVADMPDGTQLVHDASNSRHPMQFGRTAACSLLGVPEKADWKNCPTLTVDEETALAGSFRTAFEPFDLE